MKIVAQNLREILDKSKYSIAEIARLITAMQSPEKRPVRRNSIYNYLAGHTPPQDKIYMLAAILNVHPTKLFNLVCSDQKFEDAKNKLKSISS